MKTYTLKEIDDVVDSINIEIQALSPHSLFDLSIKKLNDVIYVIFLGSYIWNNCEDEKDLSLYHTIKVRINDVIKKMKDLSYGI